MSKCIEPLDELHTGQKEQSETSHQGDNASGRQNQATSSHLGSVILHDEFSAEMKHEQDTHREKDAVNKPVSACAEPSKSSRVSDQVNQFSSKTIRRDDDASVGQHIKQCFRIEKCYYSGIKRTKRCDDAVDTSTCEVTDTNAVDTSTSEVMDTNANPIARRTRRQKV